MLSSLGRRIERLFYLGFVLILLCFVEVYLSSAAAYFNQTSETAASFYINKLESQQKVLTQAYDRSREPEREQELNQRAKVVARTRETLGLPPVVVDRDNRSSKQSYQTMLKEIFASYTDPAGQVKDRFSNILNASRPPSEIIGQLRSIRTDELKQKGVVWGIETPRLFSMQYGNTDYRIPANFLSVALFSALSPVVLAWLGSFYVTRKRELLLIRELHDFRKSFPHILNVFPVTFANLARTMGIHQKRKSIYFERRVGGVVTAFFRSVLVLLFSTPMLLCSGYSFNNLYSISPGQNVIILVSGGAIMIIYFILCLQILIQESALLYKKDFYA